MEEFSIEIDRKLQDTVGQIEGTVKRIDEMEENISDMERWDIGVKDTLNQLLRNQRALRDKVSDLEGRSGCNNVRIYGVTGGR